MREGEQDSGRHNSRLRPKFWRAQLGSFDSSLNHEAQSFAPGSQGTRRGEKQSVLEDEPEEKEWSLSSDDDGDQRRFRLDDSEDDQEDGEDEEAGPELGSVTHPAVGAAETSTLLATLGQTAPATEALACLANKAKAAPRAAVGKMVRTATCGICRKSSQDVRWFIQEVVKIAEVEQTIPKSTLCWLCGVALEAWPLESSTQEGQASLIAKVLKDKKFREKFWDVRTGAERVQLRAFGHQSIHGNQTLGVVAKLLAAFVELATFATYFHVPANALKRVSVVKVFVPGNLWLEGVLLNMSSLPADLSHYTVELYAKVERTLADQMLGEDEVLREGHCQDHFSFVSNQAFPQQGVNLNPKTLNSLLTADDVRSEVTLLQQAHLAEDHAREVAGASGEGTRPTVVSGSRLVAPTAPTTEQQGTPRAKSRRSATTASSRAGGGARTFRRAGPGASSPVASPAKGGGGGVVVVEGAAISGTDQISHYSPAMLAPSGAEEFLPAGGRVNITRVIKGWKPGRELKALEHALDRDTFPDEAERSQCEMELAAANGARSLTVAQVRRGDWDDITNGARAVTLYGVKVPKVTQQLMTERFASIRLKAGDSQGWVAALKFHADTPSAEWDFAAPTFAACWNTWGWEVSAAELQCEDATRRAALRLPQLNVSEIEYLKEERDPQGLRWLGACIDDPFLRMLCDEDTAHLIQVIDAFLSELKPSQVPAGLSKYYTTAATVMRGILAITSPLPGHGGATLQDVSYIASTGSKVPPVVEGIPRVGRLMASKLRQEPWLSWVSSYRQHIGAEATHGNKFMTALEQSSLILQDAQGERELGDDYDQLIALVKTDLATWRKALRPGATVTLQKNLLRLYSIDLEGVISGVEQKSMSIQDVG